jgi:hypothetical protein
MEKKIYKFPSIEQFRNVIHEVSHRTRYRGREENGEIIYDDSATLPTLLFRGSVKLHGSNGGIVWVWNPLAFEYEFQVQSRGNILTPTSDNAGFATFVYTRKTDALLAKVMKSVKDLGYTPQVVSVYGEWCGGNIQKGVAINGLDKMFVIFAVKIDEMWLSDEQLMKIKSPEENIFNILDYPLYHVEIDFNNPKEAVEKMTKMVIDVETECPVGKAFGKTGIGEGIVWVCETQGWEGSRYWFKTKGDEHKSSGTKEKIPVDIERVNSINKLVDSFLTESRLNQGLSFLNEFKHEMSRKSTGHYVKWVVDDIVKEELDTIVGNGFEVKEISKTISDKARKWFFERLDEGVGL